MRGLGLGLGLTLKRGSSAAPGPTYDTLDALGLTAGIVWSVRLMVESYAGPAMRVRRGSDNAEADFDYGTDGLLNEAAIESWLGASDGFVVKWYNQGSGGATFDVSQGNVATQPLIAKAGAVCQLPGGIGPAVRAQNAAASFLDIGGFQNNPGGVWAMACVHRLTGDGSNGAATVRYAAVPAFGSAFFNSFTTGAFINCAGSPVWVTPNVADNRNPPISETAKVKTYLIHDTATEGYIFHDNLPYPSGGVDAITGQQLGGYVAATRLDITGLGFTEIERQNIAEVIFGFSGEALADWRALSVSQMSFFEGP